MRKLWCYAVVRCFYTACWVNRSTHRSALHMDDDVTMQAACQIDLQILWRGVAASAGSSVTRDITFCRPNRMFWLCSADQNVNNPEARTSSSPIWWQLANCWHQRGTVSANHWNLRPGHKHSVSPNLSNMLTYSVDLLCKYVASISVWSPLGF